MTSTGADEAEELATLASLIASKQPATDFERPSVESALERRAKSILAAPVTVETRQMAGPDPEQVRRLGLWRELITAIGPRYAKSSFVTYQVTRDDQTETVNRVKAYAAAIRDHFANGIGLTLIGPEGTGKDHLVVAAARQVIGSTGIGVVWKNGQDMLGEVRDRMDADGATEAAWIASLQKPQILVISDPLPPGAADERLSQHMRSMLYRVIDHRYRFLRPTWITVNADNAKELDNRLGAPTAGRIAHASVTASCFWPSFRRGRR